MAKRITITLNDLLSEFNGQSRKTGRLSTKTINNYCTWLRRIDKVNHNNVVTELRDIVYKGGDVVAQIEDYIAKYITSNSNFTQKEQDNFSSAFRIFSKYILGTYFAGIGLGISSNDLVLCQLVAVNTLFPSREVVDAVRNGKLGARENLGKGNTWASWDNMRHIRNTNVKKGTVLGGGLIADYNTIANHAIKKAVLLSMGHPLGNSTDSLRGYEACHVWDMPGDPRYYANIANLVLLPRALGQLTDHCDAVKDLLRYEVQKRFDLVPQGQQPLSQPKYYSKIVWRS